MPLTLLDEMLGSSPGESTRTAVDGDTFTTPENDKPVRLRGADTPERSKILNGAVFVGEPGAEQATQLFQQMLNASGTTFESNGETTHGRDVAFVRTAEGTDVGAELISRGAALPTKFSDPEQQQASDLFRLRAAGIGAFIDNPVARGETNAMMEAIRKDRVSTFDPFANRPGMRGGNGTFTGAVARGTDSAQASLFAAANAIGDVLGVDTVARFGEAGLKRNLLQAAENPAEVSLDELIQNPSLAKIGDFVIEAIL